MVNGTEASLTGCSAPYQKAKPSAVTLPARAVCLGLLRQAYSKWPACRGQLVAIQPVGGIGWTAGRKHRARSFCCLAEPYRALQSGGASLACPIGRLGPRMLSSVGELQRLYYRTSGSQPCGRSAFCGLPCCPMRRHREGFAPLHRIPSSAAASNAALLHSFTELFQPIVMRPHCSCFGADRHI